MNTKGLPWIGLDSDARPHEAYVLFAPGQKKEVVAAIHRSVRVRTSLHPVPGQRGLQAIILRGPPYLPSDLRALYESFDEAFAMPVKESI